MPTLSPLPHTLQAPLGQDWLHALLEAWPGPVAAATADGQRGRSPSPRHVNNKGGNRGRRRQCQDDGKGCTSSRNQTPGR